MASNGDYKMHGPRLFGVDLTEHHTDFSHDDRPVKASLGGETRANKELGHNHVPELTGSTSKSRSPAHGSKGLVCPCRYCSKKFYNSKALPGHQNAHRVRKTNLLQNSLQTDNLHYPVVGQQPTHALLKTNPFQNSLSTDSFQYPVLRQQPTHALLKIDPFQNSLSTDSFQYPVVGQQPTHALLKTNPFQNSLSTDSFRYPVVGQQPTHALLKTDRFQNILPTERFQYPVVGQQPTHPLFASNRRLPHNFELQRVDLSNDQLLFEQIAQNIHVKLPSGSLSSAKRVRNDIELASTSLPSVKRARTEDSPEKTAGNEDSEQRNTTPGRMVTPSTEDGELDLSLHL